jgi:hypothetical protein
VLSRNFVENLMSESVANIKDRELDEDSLAILVRDLALEEEKTLRELCNSVLNDANACAESKRLARILCGVV